MVFKNLLNSSQLKSPTMGTNIQNTMFPTRKKLQHNLSLSFGNIIIKHETFFVPAGLKLEKRIEEAVPAGQQLQELGMRLRCDDTSSENVSYMKFIIIIRKIVRMTFEI